MYKYKNAIFNKTKQFLIVKMTYPLNIFCQISQTQIVDNITSSNQQWNAIRLKQFEVVFVRLIAQKALNLICNKKKIF